MFHLFLDAHFHFTNPTLFCFIIGTSRCHAILTYIRPSKFSRMNRFNLRLVEEFVCQVLFMSFCYFIAFVSLTVISWWSHVMEGFLVRDRWCTRATCPKDSHIWVPVICVHGRLCGCFFWTCPPYLCAWLRTSGRATPLLYPALRERDSRLIAKMTRTYCFYTTHAVLFLITHAGSTIKCISLRRGPCRRPLLAFCVGGGWLARWKWILTMIRESVNSICPHLHFKENHYNLV